MSPDTPGSEWEKSTSPELFNLEKKKARTTPEATGHDEEAIELMGEQRQRFATAVGVLLYMSGDRRDAQHFIRHTGAGKLVDTPYSN